LLKGNESGITKYQKNLCNEAHYTVRHGDAVSHGLQYKEEMNILSDNTDKRISWLISALGIGLLVSLGVYAALAYIDRRRAFDPRERKVEELIEEAEHLLELGRKGTYYSKRGRG